MQSSFPNRMDFSKIISGERENQRGFYFPITVSYFTEDCSTRKCSNPIDGPC